MPVGGHCEVREGFDDPLGPLARQVLSGSRLPGAKLGVLEAVFHGARGLGGVPGCAFLAFAPLRAFAAIAHGTQGAR